ncbi:MAG TPA: hypothetical protein VHM69_16155 [Rubrobacter sp.]|nr:hypothetical protein [Rubrobacter sp.]
MRSESFAAVASYQRLRLREIRGLYEELDPSLEHYLGVERGISDEIDSLEDEFAQTRKTLLSLGADLRRLAPVIDPENSMAPAMPQHRRRETGSADDFRNLVRRAEGYLEDAGLDPNRDPLLQVLDPLEVAGIESRYRSEFGDVAWDESDYLVVIFAGFVATLLDVFLVRIPMDGAFLGKLQNGSPLTKWIKENSTTVHRDYFGHLEKVAKVPYDLSIGKAVDGLRPKVHRLMSPGHDPVLGFVFGVKDIMDGTGTYIDKNGDLLRIGTSMSPEDLNVAFLKVFLHLVSDVGTSAGIPPPFFTLLQLDKAKSPFVLGPSGERVSWTDVARYMYAHGYDLRHFATMGIVPASVEMIVRGWWLCRRCESGEEPELAKAKLTSMLLLGHTIAASGNLLKTGVIFGMNPLALNWAQMLALFPAAMAWVKESLKRDREIRAALDEQWLSMYRADLGYSP